MSSNHAYSYVVCQFFGVPPLSQKRDVSRPWLWCSGGRFALQGAEFAECCCDGHGNFQEVIASFQLSGNIRTLNWFMFITRQLTIIFPSWGHRFIMKHSDIFHMTSHTLLVLNFSIPIHLWLHKCSLPILWMEEILHQLMVYLIFHCASSKVVQDLFHPHLQSHVNVHCPYHLEVHNEISHLCIALW